MIAMGIDVEKLLDIVDEYLSSESEYNLSVVYGKKSEPHLKYIEQQHTIKVKNDIFLDVVCDMLDIDRASLIAVKKSMNRREKKLRYEKCIWMKYDNKESLLRLISKPKNYYESSSIWEVEHFLSGNTYAKPINKIYCRIGGIVKGGNSYGY